MRCQHHSDRPCIECDEHLVACNDCEHIDSEGDCDNSSSRKYGECVDGIVICCGLFEKRLQEVEVKIKKEYVEQLRGDIKGKKEKCFA